MTDHARRAPRTITPRDARAIEGQGELAFPLTSSILAAVVKVALEEDRAFEDVTTIATVVSDRRIRGRLVSREEGVIAGIPLALELAAVRVKAFWAPGQRGLD